MRTVIPTKSKRAHDLERRFLIDRCTKEAWENVAFGREEAQNQQDERRAEGKKVREAVRALLCFGFSKFPVGYCAASPCLAGCAPRTELPPNSYHECRATPRRLLRRGLRRLRGRRRNVLLTR
ncbi:unnamed protein product [Phaeothamnion confervicola]